MKIVTVTLLTNLIYQGLAIANPVLPVVSSVELSCSYGNRAGHKGITINGNANLEEALMISLSLFPDPQNLSGKVFLGSLDSAVSTPEMHKYTISDPHKSGVAGAMTVEKTVVGFEKPPCPRCNGAAIYGTTVKFELFGSANLSFGDSDCKGEVF